MKDKIKFGKIGRITKLIDDERIKENKKVLSLIINANECELKEEYGKALTIYEQVLSILPNNTGIMNNIGSSLTQLKRFSDAIKYYEKSLDLEPKNPLTLNNIGLVYSKLGDYDKAISYYDMALSVDSNYAMSHYNKACSKSMKGEFSEALEDLRSAIKLDGHYKQMALTDEDFINMKDLESFRLTVY